jgi:hypothetical protein
MELVSIKFQKSLCKDSVISERSMPCILSSTGIHKTLHYSVRLLVYRINREIKNTLTNFRPGVSFTRTSSCLKNPSDL